MNEKKKLQPKVRFREFTGENAPDWEQRKLGEVATLINGRAYKQNELLDQGKYRVLRVGNFNTNDRWYWSNLELEDNKYANKGELLYLWATNFGPKIWEEEKVIYHYHIWKVDYLSGSLEKKYLYTWLLVDKDKIMKDTNGSTMIHITKKNMEERKISIPVFEEQKCIGQFFEKVDKLITLHQRKLEQLEQLKNTLLSKMFPKSGTNIPKIRFSGFTDTWKQRKLGSVGTTYTGLSGKTADDFGHGDAHFITYINVFSNPIVNPNLVDSVEIDNKQHEVKIGDVFFTTSSETPGEVGMSSVLKEKHGITYLNSFCFGFRPNVKFDLDYLAYMLRSKHTRKQITLLAQGISRFNISKNKMMDINIYVPTIDEQAKIGACFYSVNKHITIHQRKLEQLKNLKQTLLNKMFI